MEIALKVPHAQLGESELAIEGEFATLPSPSIWDESKL